MIPAPVSDTPRPSPLLPLPPPPSSPFFFIHALPPFTCLFSFMILHSDDTAEKIYECIDEGICCHGDGHLTPSLQLGIPLRVCVCAGWGRKKPSGVRWDTGEMSQRGAHPAVLLGEGSSHFSSLKPKEKRNRNHLKRLEIMITTTSSCVVSHRFIKLQKQPEKLNRDSETSSNNNLIADQHVLCVGGCPQGFSSGGLPSSAT